LDKFSCVYAAEKGHLDCLEYAHKNGCCFDNLSFYNEFSNFIDNDADDFSGNICHIAAKNGHLDCLKYAHENNCKLDLWTCFYAAENGHLDCLKYLHENKCPWNEETCAAAAANGHLHCLKYAHENGCPWDILTCILANVNLINPQLEDCRVRIESCIIYAHEHGCPCIHNSKIKKYNLLLDIVSDNSDTECCICLVNLQKVQFKPCNHIACCIRCSNTLIKKSKFVARCPLCRDIITETCMLESNTGNCLLAIEDGIFD
jgi:ankyrin repeat protein